MRGIPAGMELNREQVRYICEQVGKIRAMPAGSGRVDAMKALAKKLDIDDRRLYAYERGDIKYAKKWVAEWRNEQNGIHPEIAPMHTKHSKFTPAMVKAVREKFEAGMKTSDIAKAMGLSLGSCYVMTTPERWGKYQKRLEQGRAAKQQRRANGAITRPAVRAAAKTRREEDWGQNFKAYVEAEEDKARAALAEKQEAEREALEDSLRSRRQAVNDKLLNMYTAPDNAERMD